MPVSHLTLTVSHLPTSTSFFLSCLQPLGYQFIGRHDDFIGFGQKQGEPADFWITEKKPGVLPSAAHVAFPAPSKDAVTAFFHSAIQAGGQYHGEPRTRDSQTGYYSAAVIDFDGNSIEAVYRPEAAAASVAASMAGGPTIGLLENGSAASKAGSVVSKAGSVASKAPTIKSRAISKPPTVIERSVSAPSVVSVKSTGSALAYGAPPPPPAAAPAQKVDDGSKVAKTIIGTLIGAAAGAAVAYAMVRGENESKDSETKEASVPPNLHQYAPNLLQLMAPPSQVSEARSQGEDAPRAIEAPPARSVYTSASAARSTASRSVMSKNPWASTVYEATEYYQDDRGRRASDGGSVYSIPEDAPLRAIEYPPRSHASQQRYPCNPSTFISSYAADKPRAGSVHSSASTIKTSASHRRHSTDDGYSEHTRTVYRASSSHSVHTVKSHAPSKADGGAEPAAGASSTVSSSRSARNVPLPASSSGTFYSAAPSQAGKSAVSARNVPLPAGSSVNSFYSPAASQAPRSHISARHVLLPESVIDVDVDSNVTPDDSISQVGGSRSGRSSHSHHTKHSKHSKQSKHAHSHVSGHSSKSRMDEPVRPADSVSQVSRASHRTMKAGGSKVESRRGTEVMV
ncbi:hypothetical protein POX_g09070 [Penicillium oxalicum]|uniref:hypothetical protein n=1 Tax=Penicillium oxalicum TaxID=69781 RepID=UPI0020B74312|nr:hypothetical protein POX_g09070 [Penicillium oxalicum]KAI2786682.1 hypothetical protein POX_g09070 [Penicillium oxalicum]